MITGDGWIRQHLLEATISVDDGVREEEGDPIAGRLIVLAGSTSRRVAELDVHAQGEGERVVEEEGGGAGASQGRCHLHLPRDEFGWVHA